MAMYYNGKKVRNLYYNGKCITRLALGKEMTRLVEGDDFVRAEWLCGRNGAYINTMHPLSVFEDAFEIRAKIAANAAPNPDGGENDLFGVMSDDGRRCICFYARGSGRLFFAYSNILSGGNQIYFENKNVFSAKMVADNSNFTVVCDGESKSASVGAFPQGKFGTGGITLFQLTTKQSQNYFHGDIAYFRITDPTFTIDRVNMFPCRLLRPIPASLDGNGIARNAGECGMWDKVSNKFYGNVASSGSFTVEGQKLYEEFDWLCGRNGAYINTNHKLKAFEDRFEVHARYDGTIRNPNNEEQNIFGYTHLTDGTITEICRAYINSSGGISCNYYAPDGQWNSLPNSLGVTDITLLSYVESTTHTVVLNGNTYTMSTNGMQSKEYGSFIALFSNNGDDDGGARVRIRYFHGDIAYFKITDASSNTKLHLIPVRLLRPLPAYMDANGKPRAAGECGMWDKVSDKFYGNVATSGNFTVSDN